MRYIYSLFLCFCVASLLQAAERPPLGVSSPLNDQGNEITQISKPLDFANLNVPIERSKPVAFKLPSGETHWYETVYTPKGGINWVQAKLLAESVGGYLVSLHSLEENDFVFSLVKEAKFWYRFDQSDGTFNLNGPFLGGFQPQGAAEPGGGWRWASGEPWTFENWQQEGLKIGINSKPDNQPNNNNGNQDVLAFGEVDVPMSYWSDVPHMKSTADRPGPACYGFIIEYNRDPSAV
jgi:hypothetical protein